MGRVVLASKSDEERKMETCPVFAPYPIHTNRQAESVRHCVGFRQPPESLELKMSQMLTVGHRGAGCS